MVVYVCALTSSGALQIDFGSLKLTTDVRAWEGEEFEHIYACSFQMTGIISLDI